ncbi:curculin (mannose-binding) lectin protein [Aeromonas media]|uniref:curculin (mannose-binding) lectin protein n=1 Tax=Aeromonas media TaxID=651 RepID=UPI00143E0E62|nr:curculin (mannose-binding) lectin protein [Aeromonas media]MBS4699372.1 curculin (mannose-binding) lectin protein [Aeromonas media]QIY85864.1 curculin (mannose-binding) lectin protein [Aeromonas hydrophila]
MTILSGDIKLLASQRLTDTPDGGGRVTGREIVSGEHNSLFPDISDLDRTTGVVSMRKAFMAVQTDDTDTYRGANAVVLLPPADPNVGLCLMTTKDHHDTRANARDVLERYLARGPKWRGFLYDTQLEGQRAIRFFQRVEVRLPEVGETLVLVGNEGKAGEFEQYVRILEVTYQLAKFQIPGVPEFTRNVVTCVLADPLRYTFEGEQPTPYDVVTNAKTSLRETVVADAANYFATTKLAEAVALGAMQVRAKTIFTQLVPAARSETPAVDLTAAGELASLVDSGKGLVGFNTVVSIAPSRGLFLGSGVKPGTLTITIGAATITDRGGELVVAGSVIGSIDYGRGQLEFNAQCPNYGTASKSVSFWPAARPSRIADTAQIEIKANNRGYAYTITLMPTPAPGTLTVSFMAQGKWYDLKDNGKGELFGADRSFGTGIVNLATGSVMLTLGALPDVDTSILFSWATPVNYTNRSNQPISISKSAWQLPHSGITPKSLVLTWGVGKTANDAVGDGRIRGDITGTINYAEGIIDLEHITLPALGQEYVAQYQYGEPVTERHVEPGRLSTPGQVGHLSITLDGAGGGANNLTPGSVHVKFNALYHKFNVDDQELVIQTRDPIITLRDNGQGQLIDASGNVLGAINYSAGTLHFMPDGTAPLPKPTYAWVTVGTKWVGNQQIAVQRWTMTGIQYHNTAYTFPDGEGGWVDVTYRNNNSAQAQNATLTAQSLRIDVTPGFAEAILEGSLRFTLGGSTYVDRQGLLYRDPDPATGAGIQAGTIDYSNGLAVLADWAAGQAAQPALQALATSFSAQSVDAVTFRTPGAPVAPGSLYIAANTVSGRRIEASADGDGYFTTTDMDGRVNYQTGVVTVRFGRQVTAAGNEGQPWYDAEAVGEDGKIWRPLSVVADTIRFNCVVFSYLPLDADIIGLDPVRLPSDGRVPFLRKGNTVVVHSTRKAAFPMGVTAGQQLSTGRIRLAHAHVEDKDGKQLPQALYSVNLDSGVVTLASPLNLTGYAEPLYVVHRIEDMSLVSDVEISGVLRLTKPLSHAYDPADTYVSSALIIGDLWARYTGLFDQKSWTNAWSDYLIGDQSTAQYNDTDYPIQVTNRATLQERWAIIFNSSTNFVLVGEHVGQIAVGDVNTDLAPINPNNGQPYFRLDHRGWGAGWSSGNVVRFTTQAAAYPLWVIRTILQSVSAYESDKYELYLRGNTNTP